MRSSPMIDPAQVNGEPICSVTGMPCAAWRRASSRAMGSAPAVVMSSGALKARASSSSCTGVRVTTGAPEYFLVGNSTSPPNSQPPAEA